MNGSLSSTKKNRKQKFIIFFPQNNSTSHKLTISCSHCSHFPELSVSVCPWLFCPLLTLIDSIESAYQYLAVLTNSLKPYMASNFTVIGNSHIYSRLTAPKVSILSIMITWMECKRHNQWVVFNMFNTSRPEVIGLYFADDICKCIFERKIKFCTKFAWSLFLRILMTI